MTSPGRPEQREAFLAGAVEHVLASGVGTFSLRPLAAALGTSDRMLLYYFGTRDALLTAVLERVGDHMLAGLSAVLPSEPVPADELLAGLWQVGRADEVQPALRLYLEVLGLSAARREPFVAAAGHVARGWLTWLAQRLDVPEEVRGDEAAAVLARLDGLLLLRLAAGEEVGDAAARRVLRPSAGG